MTPQATLPVLEDDIRMYPNHEEDDVPEGTLHNRWSGYLVCFLAARFPAWFVAGNICVTAQRAPGSPATPGTTSPPMPLSPGDVSPSRPRGCIAPGCFRRSSSPRRSDW